MYDSMALFKQGTIVQVSLQAPSVFNSIISASAGRSWSLEVLELETHKDQGSLANFKKLLFL